MISACSKIMAGEYEAILTGGVETNSQAPYYIENPRYELGAHNLYFHDQREEIESNAQPREKYGSLSRYDIADIIARHYGLSRVILDKYAWGSKSLALESIKNGAMSSCITPITTKINKREVIVDQDQGPVTRSMEELLAMPAIKENGTATGGNTAALADGAASIIMAAGKKAVEWECRPLASLKGFAIKAGNPVLIDKTSIKSIARSLQIAGLTLKDIDFIDIHEPSAAFALAVSEQLGSDAVGKINVDGGSLAYGHAGAATGGAMVVNMLYRLEQRDAAAGLINVGALGGQSFTIIIKR
jgi:acetyl-CoA acetyltransferase family protein